MLTFDEFATAAKQLDHITDCSVEKFGNLMRLTVEVYLSNDDGSVVERARVVVEMTPEQYANSDFSTPGRWMLQTFDRVIADKWMGYTRYTTPKEVAC